jgi:hypothetical protein
LPRRCVLMRASTFRRFGILRSLRIFYCSPAPAIGTQEPKLRFYEPKRIPCSVLLACRHIAEQSVGAVVTAPFWQSKEDLTTPRPPRSPTRCSCAELVGITMACSMQWVAPPSHPPPLPSSLPLTLSPSRAERGRDRATPIACMDANPKEP